jgi:cellulose biosynthesis protein BcsQ
VELALFQGLAWAPEFWKGLQGAVGNSIAGFIAAVLITILLYPLKKLINFVFWTYHYFKRTSRALGDVARKSTSTGRREGNGLWLAQPISRPILFGDPHIYSPPVLVVANAKGGVGKTTVAASVGARLAELAVEHGKKPILLIDLDFQGSLSSMSIAGGNKGSLNGHDSKATYLISGDMDAFNIIGSDQATVKINSHVSNVERLRIVTADYDLAQAENRVMIEWLLSDRKTDVRFRLLEILSKDAVRDAFSAIIIDCPPRLTTGAIQALAAGTHVLIPTILDAPSAEAVLTFVGQIEKFREEGICPNIKHIGVVATMVDQRQNLAGVQRWLSDQLALPKEQGGAGGVTALLPSATFIPDSVCFRDAGGKGIAYLVMGDGQAAVRVKTAIRELAKVVTARMSL